VVWILYCVGAASSEVSVTDPLQLVIKNKYQNPSNNKNLLCIHLDPPFCISILKLSISGGNTGYLRELPQWPDLRLLARKNHFGYSKHLLSMYCVMVGISPLPCAIVGIRYCRNRIKPICSIFGLCVPSGTDILAAGN